MKISRGAAVFIGFFTSLPILYLFYFFAVIIYMIFIHGKGLGGNFQIHPALIIIPHLAMMLLIICLLIFYIIYLFKTERVPNDKKTLWAVVLFLGNIFAMPFFWYLYIWRKPNALAE